MPSGIWKKIRAQFSQVLKDYSLSKEEELYLYSIHDLQGNIIAGKLRAPNLKGAIRKLEKKSFSIIKLERVAAETSARIEKTDMRELIVLLKSLSLLCRSGIRIQRSLKVIDEQTEDDTIRILVSGLRMAIEKGKSFSEALEIYPVIFSKFHIGLIRSSEAGGFLDWSIEYLAGLMEKEFFLKKKIAASLNYPFIIFLAGIAFCFGVFYLLFPTFSSVVKDLGVKLPIYTQILMNMMHMLRNSYVLMVSVILIIFAARTFLRYIKQTPQGKIWWETKIHSVPLLGDIICKAVLSHAALVLSSLMQSGVHLAEALELTAEACDNHIIGKAFYGVAEMVSEGKSISESMKLFPLVFSSNFAAMVSVGEESGELPKSLKRIATLYEAELEITLENFTKLIEPLAVGTLGVIIALLLLSVFVPIYASLNNF